ncbi:MAG: nucleoside 2-deoxyribosyltransferase [Verrucomicrobiae bacterium]|nr:nucleoside 2-deoxyribosyltransferase [Verrucomicrobiae bacterium]
MNFLPDTSVRFLSKNLGALTQRCLICRLPAYYDYTEQQKDSIHGLLSIFCSRCGHFRLHRFAKTATWNNVSSRQIANASGYIRDNQGYVINSEADVEFLKDLKTPSVAEKAHKLLRAFSKMFPIAGTVIELRTFQLDKRLKHYLDMADEGLPARATDDKISINMFPLLSFAWAENEMELKFLLIEHLCKNVNFLVGEDNYVKTGDFRPCWMMIAPKGWEYLESVGLSDSKTGFVAMSFDKSMNKVWQDALRPAIEDAGYSPLRIDKHEHNNKIDDEIIASIRGARFVISDFTEGRGGVYFEAGFAAGLNKPVIWTVREDWLNKLHFDTRQFNHISWNQNDLPAFKIALKNRIEATLGRGPI